MNARDAAFGRFYPWYARYRREVHDEPYGNAGLRDAFLAGWLAGGAHALKTSAELASLMPTLDLFNQLLGAELLERINDQEVAETSPQSQPFGSADE